VVTRSSEWVIFIGPDAKLPPTGITSAQCYKAGSDTLVDCASAEAIALSGAGKQDGMIGGAFDYRLVNKPGGGTYVWTECVFDAVTGLTWEGKPNIGRRGADNTYTNWGDGRVGDASAYVAYVNSLALCGYKNWRLPSVRELQSIVNYGVPYPGPTIDTFLLAYWAWLGTPSTFLFLYWTSSQYVGLDANWYVGFDDGGVYNIAMRYHSYHVRLVR
jgi:hypothetical protein